MSTFFAFCLIIMRGKLRSRIDVDNVSVSVCALVRGGVLEIEYI